MASRKQAPAGSGSTGFARVVAPPLVDDRPPLRRAPHALALALLLAAWFGGLFERAELALIDWRFAASARPASGGLVLVEADAAEASPARLGAALDRLVAAGALQVAFAGPTPMADAGFRAALARAGERAIVPATGEARASVRMAALDLPADPDGRVRAVPIWAEHRGEAIASLPAALLGVRVAGAPSAPAIDFSIRGESLPRLSLDEALAAGAALREAAGRDVMIVLRGPGAPLAATAQGPLPRADVLALAYETLAQQRWIVRAGAFETLAPAASLMLVLGPWFARWSWRRGLALLGLWLAACQALGLYAQARWAIALDVLPWLAAPLLSYALEAARAGRGAWWARQDSNLQPDRYERPALTN